MFFLMFACSTPTPPETPPTPEDIATPVPEIPSEGGNAEVPPDEGPTEPPAEEPPTDVPEAPPLPSACALGPHDTSFWFEVQVGNQTRRARVDLPADYDGTQNLPLIMNFHGLLMTSGLHRTYTQLHVDANPRGYIVAHPEAAPEWNVLPGSPDVAFVEAFLDALPDEVCVDPSRVYSTGLSQGGHVSYMLGCQIPHRIAAIAPVAGSDFNATCTSGPPVPNLHIHGTSDWIVDYDGGVLYDAAPEVVRDWAEDINSCFADPHTTLAIGDVVCSTRSCGQDDESTLCAIDGGGHTWPGAAPNPLLGSTNNDIDANTVILDFFDAYWR